ncbi:AUGMIN subunit 7 [Selaginella moellendorffii]|uniref:AUGMIN subunit 7 n=1 Tax=Selaginella moellendorffii TaxID=88036 RepID=UPI000D1CF39C|nr:AUGMIN subunit 7 [Selaginella moellendorffii]|eukprot:XP_024515233.1 AUGMIN subunit 7 [Selaginella moellendorffii]
MEEVQSKLMALDYPRASVPAQSLLYAGLERYALLEWLFFKLLGDKSPFTQQGAQGDGTERDEESTRTQHLAEIARFLGLTPTVDLDAVQGKGSYESRAEMLRLIVNLVEASCVADNPEWSVDDQVAKDIQFLDAISEKQAQVFSEECKLFPPDVQIQTSFPVPDVSELENKLADYVKHLADLQQVVDDLASKQNYNPNEDHSEAGNELKAQLESFLETAKVFNHIYSKEIRPWTHTMELPQLHGLGPAANRLLESYKLLLKLLRNLRSLRDSHAAIAAVSETSTSPTATSVEDGAATTARADGSLEKLVSECEEALVDLNRGLAVLSASAARVTT